MSRRISICAILLLLFSSGNSTAQLYNVWTFGYHAGLDFNYNPPKPLVSRVSYDSKGGTGGASISDSAGKLLFYACFDGTFNRFHVLMPHSPKPSEVLLGWDDGLIVPKRSGIYYFFYTKQFHRGSIFFPEIVYSIIDMNLDSGRGDYVDSFHRIILPEPYTFYGLTVMKKNLDTAWLVLRLRDSFLSYPILNKGIGLPVISHIKAHGNPPFFSLRLFQSNDNSFLVGFDYDTSSSKIYGFDFNSATGKISNQRLLKCSVPNRSNNAEDYYSAAFSPNDSLLYVSFLKNGTVRTQILQIQRYETDTSRSCRYIEINRDYYYPFVLKTAPDGKIYFSHGPSWAARELGAINFPDKIGNDCHLRFSAYLFPDSTVWWINGSFANVLTQPFVRFNFSSCTSRTWFKNLSAPEYKNFTWYFPGGDSSTNRDVVHDFPKSSRYCVVLKGRMRNGFTAWSSDTLDILKPPKADFTFSSIPGCQWIGYAFHDASSHDTLNAETGASWHWNFGDGSISNEQNPVHVYTQSGKFTVMLVYSNGFCSDTVRKVQEIIIRDAAKPDFTADVNSGCLPLEVHFADRSVGKVAKYQYDFGDGSYDSIASPVHTFTSSGIYKVVQSLRSPSGCLTTDTLRVIVNAGILPNLVPEMLSASHIDNTAISVFWKAVPHAVSYKVFRDIGHQGNFRLLKSVTDTFLLDRAEELQWMSYRVLAVDSCGNASAISNNATPPILHGENISNQYFLLSWSPYSEWRQGVSAYDIELQDSAGFFSTLNFSNDTSYRDESPLVNSQNRCYRIRAIEHSGNGQYSYSNTLCIPLIPVVFIPNTFSPNADNLNDSFKIVGLGIKESEFTIFNRWGEKVFYSKDLSKGWDGKSSGCPSEPGVYLYSLKAIPFKGRPFIRTGTITLYP